MMANFHFCDILIANRKKFTIHVTITITIHELLGFPTITWPQPMRQHSWCHYKPLLLAKLSLKIMLNFIVVGLNKPLLAGKFN